MGFFIRIAALLAVYMLLAAQVFGADLSTIHPPDIHESDVPAPRLTGSMDWEGQISLQADELLTVITDDKAWSALWDKAFKISAPKVDFKKYAIACVFLGYNARWLYSIHIGEPAEEGSRLIIPYDMSEIILELSGPFRASGQYRMKAIPKKKGYGIVLKKTRNSYLD